MKCSAPEIAEQLLAYLDKSLPVEDSDLIANHVASCQSCTSELEELRAWTNKVSGAFRAQKQVEVGCPSSEQLVAFVSGYETDAAVGSHLERCFSCQETFKLLQALDEDTAAKPSEEPAPRSVPAALTAAFRQAFPPPAVPINRTTQSRWMGRSRQLLAWVATVAIVFGTATLLMNRPEVVDRESSHSVSVTRPAAAPVPVAPAPAKPVESKVAADKVATVEVATNGENLRKTEPTPPAAARQSQTATSVFKAAPSLARKEESRRSVAANNAPTVKAPAAKPAAGKPAEAGRDEKVALKVETETDQAAPEAAANPTLQNKKADILNQDKKTKAGVIPPPTLAGGASAPMDGAIQQKPATSLSKDASNATNATNASKQGQPASVAQSGTQVSNVGAGGGLQQQYNASRNRQDQFEDVPPVSHGEAVESWRVRMAADARSAAHEVLGTRTCSISVLSVPETARWTQDIRSIRVVVFVGGQPLEPDRKAALIETIYRKLHLSQSRGDTVAIVNP